MVNFRMKTRRIIMILFNRRFNQLYLYPSVEQILQEYKPQTKQFIYPLKMENSGGREKIIVARCLYGRNSTVSREQFVEKAISRRDGKNSISRVDRTSSLRFRQDQSNRPYWSGTSEPTLVSRLTPATPRLASLRKGMALVDGWTQKPPTFVRTSCSYTIYLIKVVVEFVRVYVRAKSALIRDSGTRNENAPRCQRWDNSEKRNSKGEWDMENEKVEKIKINRSFFESASFLLFLFFF